MEFLLRCVGQGNISEVAFNYLQFNIHGSGIHHRYAHRSLAEENFSAVISVPDQNSLHDQHSEENEIFVWTGKTRRNSADE